ncbi:hypothetical protein [Bacillus thuringiensis]|uniref:hypothetical protein n=1 Tax=Bacillus thuringiensis TaxID=1428 RepID=UPI0021D64AE9|nr:hypothetical protein [Bacillus thuringiensis]MCU7666844.1 hypothetical protein [Bacillus thuringiensis]
MMTGIIAALAVTTVGCSAGNTQQKEANYTKTSEQVKETKTNTCGEVKLDHLYAKYPNVDIKAVENYLEKNDCKYNEKELEAFIADLNKNGKPTSTTNSYGSTFPYWLFLMSNRSNSHVSNQSGFINKANSIHSTTTPKTVNIVKPPVTPNSGVNLSKNPKVTSGTHNSNSSSTSSSSSAKISKGIGSSSTHSGS